MNLTNTQGGMFNTRFLTTLIFFILFIVGLGYFFYGIQPTLADNPTVDFKIEKGESFRSIGANLSQESLIKSISAFKAYAIFTGKAHKLKPGSYELSSAMSVPEILDTLSAGVPNEVVVTIPEGSTLKDIDFFLIKAGIINEGSSLSNVSIDELVGDYEFLNQVRSLEGFIFPDTYRLEKESSPKDVVIKTLDNFEVKAWPLLEDITNWYDYVILASFLEKEVPEFEDRQLVAGLLLNRLNIGMPLQVDATISYAKCDGAFLGCDNIRVLRSDLDNSSPYNTYKRIGWTPTPISNPGEEAIEAAVNSQSSPYWYYLSDKETKETIFSKTLDEHNENRLKHL
ncbi:MAG: endolytic transglycosylase MltG [Candidatus Paceibacterota bacterium]